MEDSQILALFLARDEAAIAETQQKYGALLMNIAQNLLGSAQDAEECLNDALAAAWEETENTLPEKLRPWLVRIVRNKAVSLWRRNHTQKRSFGMETLFSELEDCIPAAENIEEAFEQSDLSERIGSFLMRQTESERSAFLRRYFLGESLGVIAASQGISAKKLANRLFSLRRKLRKYLEKEDLSHEKIC